MNSRDRILTQIRAATLKKDQSLPEIPFFHQHDHNLFKRFEINAQRMGATVVFAKKDAFASFIREKLDFSKQICSLIPEVKGDYELKAEDNPSSLNDVEVGILPASFGVAETGSICLTEDNLVINSLGYLSQHLIVVLNQSDIVENIHDAYLRSEWQQVHYASLHSGPSATADIEAVLIRGAQGVRSLTIYVIE